MPPQDREHANSLFLTATGEPTALHTSFLEAAASGSAAAAPSLVSSGTKTFEPGVEAAERDAGKAGRLLTKEEKDRVRKAIEGAESVEEVRMALLASPFAPAMPPCSVRSWKRPCVLEHCTDRSSNLRQQIRRLQRMLAQGFV